MLGPSPGVHPGEEHPGPPKAGHHRQGVRPGVRVLHSRPQEDGGLQPGEQGGAHLGERGRQAQQGLGQVHRVQVGLLQGMLLTSRNIRVSQRLFDYLN